MRKSVKSQREAGQIFRDNRYGTIVRETRIDSPITVNTVIAYSLLAGFVFPGVVVENGSDTTRYPIGHLLFCNRRNFSPVVDAGEQGDMDA